MASSTGLNGYLDWPHAAQVCQLTRTVTRKGRTTREVEYAVTSEPRSRANAARLLRWWRDHWKIENRPHYIRDVTMGEDVSRIRSGTAPENLASVRNAAIGLLRRLGHPTIAAALRTNALKVNQLLDKLGIL